VNELGSGGRRTDAVGNEKGMVTEGERKISAA
jgi:hypothetical protein